jgi:predicted DNA-binding transcriptional regulator AlpA
MNLLTLSEVGRRLGVSERTVRQFKSELPGAVRIGRRVKYTEEAITEFVRRGGCRPVESPSVGSGV